MYVSIQQEQVLFCFFGNINNKAYSSLDNPQLNVIDSGFF